MAERKYANFATTKLTAQLLSTGVTANVTTNDGALFAAANGSDWTIGVLRRMSGYKDVAHEIVKITNRATDALTITRAQEGTGVTPNVTGLQFEIGDQLDIEFTAASFSGGAIGGFVDNETPAGTINSSNVTFTLATAPSPTTSLRLFVDGVRQRLTTDYSLSGLTITFVAGATPQTGSNLIADYRY